MLQLIAFVQSRLGSREDGATMVEYGLMVALIAVVVAAGAKLLGERVDTLFDSIL